MGEQLKVITSKGLVIEVKIGIREELKTEFKAPGLDVKEYYHLRLELIDLETPLPRVAANAELQLIMDKGQAHAQNILNGGSKSPFYAPQRNGEAGGLSLGLRLKMHWICHSVRGEL